MSMNAISRRAAAKRQLEDLPVERERLVDIAHLERDVVDARRVAVAPCDHATRRRRRRARDAHVLSLVVYSTFWRSDATMELGLYTFAELTPDPATGRTIPPALRLRNLIEEATLADEVGLDVFGIGEHHRPDFAVSAPAIALAAVAARTSASG